MVLCIKNQYQQNLENLTSKNYLKITKKKHFFLTGPLKKNNSALSFFFKLIFWRRSG